MNLVWFRNDLRVNDNPALSAALEDKNERVVAVYCLCIGQWSQHGMGANQQSLILQAVNLLEASLKKLNIPLVILNPNVFDNVPMALLKLSQQLNVSSLYFNMEYPLFERRRDKSVVELLEGQVACHRKVAQSLVAPWEIVNADGGGYKVFSAYARKVHVHLDANPPFSPLKPVPRAADNLQLAAIEGAMSVLPAIEQTAELAPVVDEASVINQLENFCDEKVSQYKQQRDYPAITGTSEISSALAIGTVSVVRCYQTATQTGVTNSSTWVNELIWRDFYRSVMWNYPHVCKGQAFRPVDKSIRWSNNQQQLEAWKNAETGIPIIDAAMTQLNQTGWMHNRLRMIVASYLTKNLFFDWRQGEAYFAEQLFDFDFASNNGGWQWSASVGTDAAPYFRVFNPASQQKKFDSQADFIKQWLPQLSEYSAKAIHQFETVQLAGYCAPQVDLKTSRKFAIESFKQARVA